VKVRISAKGQITIPAEARHALRLTAGTEVELLVRKAEIVLRKGRTGDEPVDRVYGIVRSQRSSDHLLEEMRGPGLRSSG